MVDLARRGFFRGRPRPRAEIRPPWALPESAFIDSCTRCNDCVSACPTGIIQPGDGGSPTLDCSRGECTFCGDCLTACKPVALVRPSPDTPAWTYRARLDAARCLPSQGIECRICGEHCDARAIRFIPRLGGSPLPTLDPDTCTGCGACIAPCPAQALKIGA